MSDATDAKSPEELTTEELRGERARLNATEDAVSMARRLIQARLDHVSARLGDDVPDETTDAATQGGAGHPLGTGSQRPPRSTDVVADPAFTSRLEGICERLNFLGAASQADLENLRGELSALEAQCSARRRELFGRVDALTAELVNRYRDGSATPEWSDHGTAANG